MKKLISKKPLIVPCILTVFAGVIFSPLSVLGEEPEISKLHVMKSGEYGWRIDHANGWYLSVMDLSSKTVVGRYDLGLCFFCSGEEDNCDRDGVRELQMSSRPDEPTVIAVCHVGAHSQRLMVLAPNRDRVNPALAITGDYWVDYEASSDGLKISYDRRNEEGEFVKVEKAWPE